MGWGLAHYMEGGTVKNNKKDKAKADSLTGGDAMVGVDKLAHMAEKVEEGGGS